MRRYDKSYVPIERITPEMVKGIIIGYFKIFGVVPTRKLTAAQYHLKKENIEPMIDHLKKQGIIKEIPWNGDEQVPDYDLVEKPEVKGIYDFASKTHKLI